MKKLLTFIFLVHFAAFGAGMGLNSPTISGTPVFTSGADANFRHALSLDTIDIVTFQGLTVSGASILNSSTTPSLTLNETDASANNKRWQWFASGETLSLILLNDAVTASGTILSFTRSGITPASATANGDWTYTGGVALNGTITSTDMAARRSDLGLEIGADVQAWDADLDTLSDYGVANQTQAEAHSSSTLLTPSQAVNATKSEYAAHPIVFDGDSRTQDYSPLAGKGNSWATKLMQKANWKDRGTPVNLAVSGGKVSEIAAEFSNVQSCVYSLSGQFIYALHGIHNDATAGRSAAQIEADLTTIANGVHARGGTFWLIGEPAADGGLDAGMQAVIASVMTWAAANPTIVDKFTDLSSITNSDTLDNVHYSESGVGSVATLADLTWPSGPWGAPTLQAGRTFYGTSYFYSAGSYSAAVVIDRLSGVTRTDGTNSAAEVLQRANGAPFFQYKPEIYGRGVRVGDNGNSAAPLDGTLTFSGAFTVSGWVQVESRVLASGSNTAVLLADPANGDLIGIAAGSSGGYLYALENSSNIISTIKVYLPIGKPSFVTVTRDSNNRMYFCVNGAWSSMVVHSGTFTFTQAFGYSGGTAYLQGCVWELDAKAIFYTADQTLNVMRGGSFEKANTGASSSLQCLFDEGIGYSAYDQSANARHIRGQTGSAKMEWLYPRASGRVRGSTASASSVQLTSQLSTPTNAILTAAYVTVVSGTPPTISIGKSSGTSEFASSVALGTGTTVVPITPGVISTGNIYITADNNSPLKETILYTTAD